MYVHLLCTENSLWVYSLELIENMKLRGRGVPMPKMTFCCFWLRRVVATRKVVYVTYKSISLISFLLIIPSLSKHAKLHHYDKFCICPVHMFHIDMDIFSLFYWCKTVVSTLHCTVLGSQNKLLKISHLYQNFLFRIVF